MIYVVNVLTDSNIGGAGRCLVSYLRRMDRKRYRAAVVLPVGSALIPEVRALDVPVIEAEGIAERSFSLAGLRSLLPILRREKPDIVHTHGALSGRIAGKLCGAKVVYTRHSAFPVPAHLRRGPGRWLGWLLSRFFADGIIAVSPAAAENLVDSGVPEKKITVMMNGVDPLTRPEEAHLAALREALGLPQGVFTGGLLARLEPYKGQMLLLEAAKRLRDQGRDFWLLIAGAGSQEGAIRQKIDELGLRDTVVFPGFLDDVAGALSLLDVQLNCSWGTEASSLALIEGMSLGLPTLASDYGGNPWQVEDGVTGLLFPSGDSAALAEGLKTLMDDPALRRRLGENARKAYQSRFTAQVFARNVEAVYEKAAGKQ